MKKQYDRERELFPDIDDDIISEFLVDIIKQGVKCGRCEYKWIPKHKNKLPKNCPRCNSPYWNKPRKRKN